MTPEPTAVAPSGATAVASGSGPVVLDDRYRLDEQIGSGGMADVYRATDELLNRAVAVKVLREAAEPSFRERFTAEARILASLNHPGLVTLLDAGILGDRLYLVMALADDSTLSERIATGPLDPAEVKTIGIQLAHALAYAHGEDVVHRDVKPSNILLCGDGRALLADFGIARLVGNTEHHTKTGDAIGSPAYLAPEQVAGEELTPAVDIYSLGLVLLEALTGRRAYTGSQIEAAMARLTAGPALPTSLDPGWRALLARMTHREPGDRPTAAEVADELAIATATDAAPSLSMAEDEDVDEDAGEVTMESPLPAVGPVERETGYVAAPPPGRSIGRWVLVAATVLALVFVAVLIATQRGGSSANPVQPVPSGVPTRLVEPLQDLHQTIEGESK